MKLVLSLAAAAALVFVAFQTANAVDDPPTPHVQLVEIEQMTPYLESASLSATSQTQSRIVRQSGGTFSGQAYAQFDNHNGDLSRASFPLEVEDGGDAYGISAVFVRGPNFGIVQVSIDNQPIGEPFDAYAATTAPAAPITLGTRALAEGKHILTLTVTGKNAASSDWLAGLDLLVLDSDAAGTPPPVAEDVGEAGGTVPATLALTLGAPAQFGAFTPGVSREYTAATTANVISTAAEATLSTSDPGHLTNGTYSLPQPLRVDIAPHQWDGPVANAPVTIAFTQAIGANDSLRTGVYAKTLTFTLSTTNP